MTDEAIETALIVFDDVFMRGIKELGWKVGKAYPDWSDDEKAAARAAMRAAIKSVENKR